MSAKAGDARPESAKELANSSRGASSAQPVSGVVRDSISTAAVLRGSLESAKGTAACRQTAEERAKPLGGTLKTGPVLREFLNSSDPHGAQPILRAGLDVSHAQLVLVLLHGRGASAEDILSLGPSLAPDAAYLAPQAANYTWYPNSFLAPRVSNEPYLSSALRKVLSIVEDLKTKGVGSERIAICGFSQGACLASEFVATHPQRYAGLIAFTGGLIGPLGTDLAHSGDLAGTPAFLGSGDPDPHVPWQRVAESAEIFKAMGASVTAERYPGMPHTVSPSELKSARTLLGS
jgi:phospholipase/carboxylesterase